VKDAEDQRYIANKFHRIENCRTVAVFEANNKSFIGKLSDSLDDVNAGVSEDDARDLADLKGKCGVFEGLLHRAALKETQITTRLGTGAIGVRVSNILELVLATDNDFTQLLDVLDGLSTGSALDALTLRISEALGVTRLAILDQEVKATNLSGGSHSLLRKESDCSIF